MKKLMIAFLCCFGVGLTMMASPAQLSDDDITVDAKNKTAVQTKVSKRNNESTRQLIKHEWKMKKVDFSKMNGPKRVLAYGVGASMVRDLKVHHPIPTHKPIDPVKRPLPGDDSLLWESLHNGDTPGRFMRY